MHHKVFIIDEEIVITGSFNPSKNADTRNDENILIINKKTMKKTDFSYELTKEDFVKFNMYHMDKQYRKYHFRMISFIL